MKTIIVLGAKGMLGRVMYKYLNQQFPGQVLGTARRKTGELIGFDAAHDDPAQLWRHVGETACVINCVALMMNYPNGRQPTAAEFVRINADFPHQLEASLPPRVHLIHFSTDAVFSPRTRLCFESSHPAPDTWYGASKWLGETSHPHALTWRTSIVGFDPHGGKGLIELVAGETKQVTGFANQLWAGATTLQIATLIGEMIARDQFPSLRRHGPVLHLAPLSGKSKYGMMRAIAASLNRSDLRVRRGAASQRLVRRLKSAFVQTRVERVCGTDWKVALAELVAYEKT